MILFNQLVQGLVLNSKKTKLYGVDKDYFLPTILFKIGFNDGNDAFW